MLDAGMKTQLKAYLENLRMPIELVASVDDSAHEDDESIDDARDLIGVLGDGCRGFLDACHAAPAGRKGGAVAQLGGGCRAGDGRCRQRQAGSRRARAEATACDGEPHGRFPS